MGGSSSKPEETNVKIFALQAPNTQQRTSNNSVDEDCSKLASGGKNSLSCDLGRCEPPANYTEMRKQADREYESLVAKLNAQGILWEDADFPAADQSLGDVSVPPDCTWKRPKDINSHAKLFVDGLSRFDINQGALGNCWLLAVLSDAAINKCMMSFIMPQQVDIQESRYCGVFRAIFWFFGRWTQVMVDDRLPSTNGTDLIFMSSNDKNEMWSSLLEKAYAKLYGNYGNLNGGFMVEAMEDVTGGLGEFIRLDGQITIQELAKRILWYQRRCCLMCGGILFPPQREMHGLAGFHAYSITGAAEVRVDGFKLPLVRVRNPWGTSAEWTGPWSDNSAEWAKVSGKDKKRLKLRFHGDGEFWMSVADFSKYFTIMNVCHLTFETLLRDETMRDKLSMKETVLRSQWIGESAAGSPKSVGEDFLKNPQFLIQIEVDEKRSKQSFVFFALMQYAEDRNHAPIGFILFQVPSGTVTTLAGRHLRKDAKRVLKCDMNRHRTVVASKKLTTGTYILVPYTSLPGVEKPFLIRIFSEAKIIN